MATWFQLDIKNSLSNWAPNPLPLQKCTVTLMLMRLFDFCGTDKQVVNLLWAQTELSAHLIHKRGQPDESGLLPGELEPRIIAGRHNGLRLLQQPSLQQRGFGLITGHLHPFTALSERPLLVSF